MRAPLLALALVPLANADLFLHPDEEMEQNCFGFPTTNFHRTNCVKAKYGDSPQGGGVLTVGEPVFDFTLYDLDGEAHTLSKIIEQNDQPVVMIWGMWTCPAYQGMGKDEPVDECSYTHEWDLVEAYKDQATFLHLVGPEPHPLGPDTNFDTGKQLMNYWSVVRQAKTWDDRKEMATRVAEYTHPDAILLMDLLLGNEHAPHINQPVWCTFGLAARSALVISTDGKLAFAQDWFRASDVSSALDSLVRPQSS